MGLLKWIKRELDSSNSCKRRQSEPPLSGNSSQLPRDESYVKALSKFNEWRQRQLFGGTARLSRKQSKKLIERRGQSDTFFENRNITNDKKIVSKNVTSIDNSLYEEIQVNHLLESHQNDLSSSPVRNTLNTGPVRHSYPATDIARAKKHRNSSVIQSNDLQIYENTLIELVNQFDQSPDILNISKHILSPPVKFFKENSNPFANVRTPIRDHQRVEKYSDDLVYESPRDLQGLDALRATFKPFTEEEVTRDSIASNGRLSRNPPYQTVINKHGDEVEYALPLNEKFEDHDEEYCVEDSKDSQCKVVALNNTSSYQQYIDENFQFLNEKDTFGVSHMSVSFGRNQFYRGNVLVTDLDKTNGTKVTDDQNNSKERDIIQELESLEVWSRNIRENIGINSTKKSLALQSNMHFAEIVVCNSDEVTEKDPRQVFETLSGTLHSGTFHCVPITQFKSHRREQHYCDSALQLNYEILRKIRHPDIALLMGITVDNKCALDSLILEPLTYSLNHFIHKEGGCIPISICLLYTIQINNAVTYLHKHGLVHSNISTHSIVMCQLSNSVKLTSFELTTVLNGNMGDELMAVVQNGKKAVPGTSGTFYSGARSRKKKTISFDLENQQLNSATQLPYKLRPYNIDYRKSFCKHNYQAPELLSRGCPFVFPKMQCDVYGICLTLWEMVNCSIPFVDFDYDEMVKLIYLQNTQLPTIQEERQIPFEKVLRLGLNLVAEKRISDTIELSDELNKISLGSDNKPEVPSSENKILSLKDTSDAIPTLLGPRPFGPMIYERTSTIKKRKNVFGENRLTARQLFVYSQIEKLKEPSEGMVPSHTSSPNSPRYGFEIGEVSIPETPIARSNKLRKAAWLSNQSISPIVHLEIKSNDDDAAINQIQIVENKISNACSSVDTLSPNKLYNVNIRLRANSKKTKTPSKNVDISQTLPESCSPGLLQKNSSQISDHIKFFNSASTSIPQLLQTKTSCPVQNLVNYNKNTAKPAPVKENVFNQVPVSQNNINEFFCRSQPLADFENSLWRREKQKCDQSLKTQRRISVKDAVNKFESFSKSLVSESNSPKTRSTISSSSSHSDQKKKSTLDRQPNDNSPENSISKLNVVLRNKSDNSCKEHVEIDKQPQKSEVNSECDSQQNPMLTLNFKNLDRRASDLGSYYIRQNPKAKGLTARHSIYGSEIFKRLRNAKASTDTNGEDEKEGRVLFEDKKKDFKVKVGKLTCLNCGHKLFVVDDIVPSNSRNDVNEPYTELLLTPLKRNLGLHHVSKSTEDFYIDDDFCEDIELCANMELGTRSHLSDLIDFDILSAEIFNPTEETPNQFV